MLVALGCQQPDLSDRQTNAQQADIAFTDVTTDAGLDSFKHETGAFGEMWLPETMGAGGGFLDYDNDGWLDVLLVGGGTWPSQGPSTTAALRLYRNNHDGTFTDQTTNVGLASLRAYGFGVTMADYDNDGDDDVFLATLYENVLLRNDEGVFVDVALEAGVAGEALWSATALFFDADRDGWLDLLVGNYVEWTPETDIWCSLDGTNKTYCTPIQYPSVPSAFYRNNGDGTFSEQAQAVGLQPAPGKTLGLATLDFNADGWSDIIVANDTERDLLFENQGDGTFVERGLAAGIAFDENGLAKASMGLAIGDLEGSGQPTYVVGGFSQEMNGIFRYAGNGLFMDRSAASRIGRPSLPLTTFGLFLFDVENDGDLDLVTVNGHIFPEVNTVYVNNTYRQPTQLYINKGEGTFEEVGAGLGSPFTNPLLGRGAAYGDYDRDGDLDVLITENGGAALLWRNDTEIGSFLRVHLEGETSNRSALGARVLVKIGDEMMERRMHTGSSYMSQSETVAHFGLGAAIAVDSLLIHWPSGHTDRFASIPRNQEIHIREASSTIEEMER